ncbi:MAG: hypothetical protein ACK5TG_19340, partial [Planctomyces sp.]
MAPPLVSDPAIVRRVDQLGAPGGPLHGYVECCGKKSQRGPARRQPGGRPVSAQQLKVSREAAKPRSREGKRQGGSY